MKLTRRLLVLAAMLALPLAMVGEAAGAPPSNVCNKKHPDYPSCAGGTQPGVEVSIEASLTSAHELGDTIYYTIAVTNDSTESVSVTDELTELDVIVDPKGSPATGHESPYSVRRSYTLGVADMPPEIGDTVDLVNTVTAEVNDQDVAQAKVTVTVAEYGLCEPELVPDGNFQTGPETCIWKPPPGNYVISVVPDSARQTRVMITVRDHTPGNWCPQGLTERWRPGGDPVKTTVIIPEWANDWAGESVCPAGGAAGNFYEIGTPGSFYLDTEGTVTIG